MTFDAAAARALVQRDLRDESAVKWTANEIDRAVNRALQEYSEAWPTVQSKDVAMGSTDTLDVSSEGSYMYSLWVEYPTGNVPPTKVRFEEELRGKVRIVDSSQPVEGETCRVWYAKYKAIGDVPVEHQDLVILGATAFAALAAGVGATGSVNVSGWTPRQYADWGKGRLAEYRERLRQIKDLFSCGGPVHVWSSADL